jgi:hypothetical protein
MLIEPRRSPLDRVSPGLLVTGVHAWLYLGSIACISTALCVLSAIAGLVVPLVIASEDIARRFDRQRKNQVGISSSPT